MVGGGDAARRLAGAEGDHRPDQEAQRPPHRPRLLTGSGTAPPGLEVRAREGLDAGELDAVDRLRRRCEAVDGSDLKIQPGPPGPGAATQFLATVGGEVVGYCGIDDGRDAEVCGMVNPAHRRAGIGGALLDAALKACSARGRETALVICEDTAPAAGAWMGRRGGVVDSSELRLVLDRSRPWVTTPAPGDPEVDLRPATTADHEALVGLLTEGFAELTKAIAEVIARRLGAADEETWMAVSGGEPVGTVRLVPAGRRWMIYGLVIRRERRGRRLGTVTMEAALAELQRRGAAEVSLEVDPANTPAVRLYEGLGFRRATTYRYWRVTARG